MKINKYTYAVVAAILGSTWVLSSCENYLDIQPVGKVIPHTLEEYRALFTTAYQQPLNDRGVTEIRTDIAQVSQATATPLNTFGDIEKWNDATPNASTREFGWAPYYSNIYYANAIIHQQHQITEGTPNDIEQLVGEAYFMRSYMHFLLVNLYGEPYTKAGGPESKAVPLKHDLDLEAVPHRQTVQKIYAAVLEDLKQAGERMHQPLWEKKYSYRFSALSVDALASRVYLYMGEWENAYQAAERVLAKKADLEDLNRFQRLPNHFESVEMITAYEIICNSDYASSFLVQPSFYALYAEGKDLRRTKYFEQNEKGDIVPLKFGNNAFKCSFRTGEMYLNAAEAAVHLNRLPEARQRLLTLLQHRYTPEGYEEKKANIESLNQEQLLEEILLERARELAFEGHRWFDLRRTTRPRIEKVINQVTYAIEQNDSRYTLRIPKTALDANPGLLN